MKEFKIPMIDQSFFIYIGEDDYYTWVKHVKKEVPRYLVDDECTGLTGGSTADRLIWLGNSGDEILIYHELSHYFHFLFNEMACSEENEFKAYISSWVHSEVFKYIEELIK